MSEVKTKKCRECPVVLPEDQFPRVTAKGKTYYQARCPECQRRYSREYYQKEKRRIGEIRKARRGGDEHTAHELLKRTHAAREREALGDQKKCSRCERLGRDSIHPKHLFAKSSYAVDGYQPWCMACVNEDQAEKRRQRRERRTLYLVTRPTCDPSEPPVEGARLMHYHAADGEMLPGWFIRFPRAGELERFLEEHAPATVRLASTNPELKEIVLHR